MSHKSKNLNRPKAFLKSNSNVDFIVPLIQIFLNKAIIEFHFN